MYKKIKSAVFQLIQPSKGNIISKIFDIFIIILISANLITIIVETFDLPDDVRFGITTFEIVSVIIFTIISTHTPHARRDRKMLCFCGFTPL